MKKHDTRLWITLITGIAIGVSFVVLFALGVNMVTKIIACCVLAGWIVIGTVVLCRSYSTS